MNSHTENKYNQLNPLILLSSSAAILFFLIQLQGFYHDDAYIILRYAKNILAGNGIVWNIGDRVEGYSSFLWLILISLLGYFRFDLFLASRILGVVFAIATLLLFFILDRKRSNLGALLLSTNSCFALWALGGLETVAFGFFVFLGCYLFQNNYRNLKPLFVIGFIFSLATMTRPEGLLFFTITFVFYLLKELKLTNTNFKAALWLASGFLTSYLPYFLWRLYYFGHLFPCTFYVKGGTDFFKLLFGARYIFHFLLMYGFPLGILFFVKGWKRFFREQAYLVRILVYFGFYILLIGGDHMQGFRFMVPVLPLMYLFIQNAFYQSRFINKPVLCNTCLIVIVVINILVSYRSIPQGPEENQESMSHSYKYRECFKIPDPAAYIGKFAGTYIKSHWPPDATIAGNIAGSIPYFSDLRFIDMLGLNDYRIAQRDTSAENNFPLWKLIDIKQLFSYRGRSEIVKQVMNKYLPWQLIPGHGKGDGSYVLSKKPEYIIIGLAEGDTKPWFLSDKEILSDPDFPENYALKEVTIDVPDALHTFYAATQTGTLRFRYYERKKQGS